jgi:hypothetical protein
VRVWYLNPAHIGAARSLASRGALENRRHSLRSASTRYDKPCCANPLSVWDHGRTLNAKEEFCATRLPKLVELGIVERAE